MRHMDDPWQDPRNWQAGIFYFCRDDPRLFVPKRLRWTGWTLNFARPGAYVFMIGLIVLLWVVMGL